MRVEITGLDRAYRHVVKAVENSEDTGAAGHAEDVQYVKVAPVNLPPDVLSLGAIPDGLAGIAAFSK